MEKVKLNLQQEANMLYYVLYQKGKIMKGDTRTNMYEIYNYFKGDRDASICSCLDRDTARKVDGFINAYQWSDETKYSQRFAEVFPHLALIEEELKEEFIEESTQPIDMNEVLEGMMNKQVEEIIERAKPVPVKPIKRVRKTK